MMDAEVARSLLIAFGHHVPDAHPTNGPLMDKKITGTAKVLAHVHRTRQRLRDVETRHEILQVILLLFLFYLPVWFAWRHLF
jgi:hypothetical protein